MWAKPQRRPCDVSMKNERSRWLSGSACNAVACGVLRLSRAHGRSDKSRRAAGLRPSGAACAKKGASGRMQRPPELVPIPESLLGTSLVPPWYLLGTSGRLRESSGKLLHFGKIPKKLVKI